MAIKSVLTYEISEAAAALGVSVPTIRNWIKDGLPVMASQKPHLISGAELRAYLRAKNEAAKKPLSLNELTCFRCRAGRKPSDMSVRCVPNTARTSRLAGECEECGSAASRLISNTRREEFAAIFKIKTGANRKA
jgi:hypothetical protein